MTRALTIAFLVPRDPMARGSDPRAMSGGDVYNRQLAAALARRGHDVRWVPTAGTEPLQLLADPQLRDCDVWLQDELGHVEYLALNRAVGPSRGPRATAALVHVPAALLGEPSTPGAEARYLAGVDGAVFVSDATRRDTAEVVGAAIARSCVAHPGTDHVQNTARRSRGNGELVLVAVGHVARHKGYPALIAALDGARRLAPDATARLRATIVGAPVCADEESAVSAAAAQSPVPVELVGALGRADLEATLAGADLFVQTSTYESWGIAAAEAVACGVPVISCTPGGPPEWLRHGTDSLLCPAGDIDAVARGIARWCRDPGLREALAAGCRAAPRVTWDDTAGAVDSLLQELAHGRRTAR